MSLTKIFITYGDAGFEDAKSRIVNEAKSTGEFDHVLALGRDDLSSELLSSDIINQKRGGGFWSWKPDVILSTMNKYQDGDAIIYCDAGCSIYPSSEWRKIWKTLESHDIIAQRIFQRTDKWTRCEIIEYFKDNGTSWLKLCQFQATIIIIRISDFTRNFVKEWRDLMIEHSEFAMDVPSDKLKEQLPCFIENRHDQAIYSALVYKYLNNSNTKNKIFTQWEHIEDYDPIFKQAIRATRLRYRETEQVSTKVLGSIKRIIKDYMYKPFYYAPIQWWYQIRNL